MGGEVNSESLLERILEQLSRSEDDVEDDKHGAQRCPVDATDVWKKRVEVSAPARGKLMMAQQHVIEREAGRGEEDAAFEWSVSAALAGNDYSTPTMTSRDAMVAKVRAEIAAADATADEEGLSMTTQLRGRSDDAV